MFRHTPLAVREALWKKMLKNDTKWDPTTNQKIIELQDVHFMAVGPYIVNHDKVLYDDQWYVDNYDVRLIGQDWNRQYFKCIDRLANDPYSRRAVIYMGSPDECLETFPICTMTMHMILDGLDGKVDELNWIVNMRSNSVIKFTTDYLWQKRWFDRAVEDLSNKSGRPIKQGVMFWNADSMHIYEEDFDYLRNTMNEIYGKFGQENSTSNDSSSK